MLVLFDIDGTLLLSHRAGLESMKKAAQRMVGPHFTFDGVEFAGRLDPLIWADAAAANGFDRAGSAHDEFRTTYAEILKERFRHPPAPYLLPGVAALVDALENVDDLTLGLLTGNYPETGRLKIEAAGLDPDRFTIGAWGSDGASRRDLPRVAMDRYRDHRGRAITSDRVVVIGDTPHDVDCAHANGCRVIAVATGPSCSLEELSREGADLTVEDLSETDRLVQWIGAIPAATE